jgi:hypothetical protein
VVVPRDKDRLLSYANRLSQDADSNITVSLCKLVVSLRKMFFTMCKEVASIWHVKVLLLQPRAAQ